ncbi:uncharacterized protein BXZ73DRAFT_91217 [Epithele typhae]|uniref:uncharacterized protein n=1 Tax=Epithele typhae TaxID=378194 RepID=UPI0020082B71|nr:uncharacterized protein BXZ73DRAFT_91217 [Epithele typhae]KAH9924623.1 hypothetical protein BXZ73DRAFT_91217 [Epithele typhae]
MADLAWLDSVNPSSDSSVAPASPSADIFGSTSSMSSTPSPARSPNFPSQPQASTSTSSPSPAPPRRRIRPKIALDANQPLTARGKPRARVYVACNQCRLRKTRCDGAKPVCFNCRKRPPEDGECNYEEQPKRRGQDRVPGVRIRSASAGCLGKRRRLEGDDGEEDSEEDRRHDCHDDDLLRASYDNFPPLDDETEDYDPFPLVDLDEPNVDIEFYTPPPRPPSTAIPPRPGLQFTRETWDLVTMSSQQRTSTLLLIVADLRALFTSSLWWMSFIHLPRFWDTLLTPSRRTSMQPSLVLSALAVGVFCQSSEAERGAAGRRKALRLMELALSSVQGSLASGWVDFGLIQATWLLAYFELQAHPGQSLERHRSSLVLLDSLVRLFSLTTLDADILGTHFTSRIPVASDPNYMPADFLACADPLYMQPEMIRSRPPKCNCQDLTIGRSWPSVRGIAPSWMGTPMWPDGFSEAEFRKEECRRLVWASVALTASMNSYVAVLDISTPAPLWLKNPEHYALMFPGESLTVSGTFVAAPNVWTLYYRTMLLLHDCVRKRQDMSLSGAEMADFAVGAWLEIDALDRALNEHTCMLERNLGFQAREMLFSARMCISHEFQRYIPQITTRDNKLFYRDKAESWCTSSLHLAAPSVKGVAHWTGLAPLVLDQRRPVLIYWHMSHVMKAMKLWEADHTLLLALEAAKQFGTRTEYMMLHWPSTKQRETWQALRFQLVQACIQCGVTPPDRNFPTPLVDIGMP